MKATSRILIALAVLAFAALPALAAPGAMPTIKTLENLQAAYNGESNAHARYLAFAKKADEEGYGAVASLFRAASRAEEIHAANHAKVIRGLGGSPTAKIEAPVVKTTRENLQAAIQGESYERDKMYPEFLATARREKQKGAVKTLNLAKTAEAEHAKLYAQALKDLDKLKGSKSANYFVCSQCGYTTAKLDFAKCPSCFAPKDKYEKVG